MTGRVEHDIQIEKTLTQKLLTMPDYATGWYENLKASGSTMSTCRNFIGKLHAFLSAINENVSEVKPEDITLDEVQKYFISIQKKVNRNGEIEYTSTSYRCGIWFCLHNFFNYMVLTHQINENYMDYITKPKNRDLERINQKRVLLDKNDFKKLLQVAENGIPHEIIIDNENTITKFDRLYSRNKAIIWLFLTTGMRRTALTEIDIEDVNLNLRTITVVDKGNKTHVYNLAPKPHEALRFWIKDRNEIIKDTKTKSHALFLSNEGNRLHQNTITKLVSVYCKEALGYTLSPHKLRAGFCSVLYEETGDIEYVRRVVGHSNISTTQRYIVTRGDERKRASSFIDSLMEENV